MSIPIKVSAGIINNVAKMYQSTSRIFMEYIDNSLDSAEKFLDKTNSDTYQRLIQITVKINTKDRTVTFEDNCAGMDRENLLRIAEKVGESNKKGDFTTNGQFGFGIHSYAACASNLEVTTITLSSDVATKMRISRDAYIDGGEIEDLQEIPKNRFPLESGTIVSLSNFDREWWRDINPQDLKSEIEKHFEQLLGRQNLEVKILYDNEEIICQPFNYDSELGIPFEKEISKIVESGNVIVTLPQPIKVYLKVTKNIIPNKRPVFINKGRRIEEIQGIKSFRSRSKYKTSVWGHNNLTGYIDVSGQLNPTIARDDFDRDKRRSSIYEEILKIEEEIYDYLQKINKESEDTNMNKFQDILSSALSTLAREDNLRFRTNLIKGNDINLFEDPKGKDKISGEKLKGGKGTKETENHQKEQIPVTQTDDETEMKGKENKKSGFDVEFSDREQRLSDGTLVRSSYSDGTPITIYKTHPDFQARIRRTNQGGLRITERLISYLSAEIAINYKDKFFETKGKQPQVQAIMNSRKDLFVDIVDFSYRLEQMLQPYVGKDLLTLENLQEDEE